MMPLPKRAEGDLELPQENQGRTIIMTMLNDIPMDKPITADWNAELIAKAESMAAKTRFLQENWDLLDQVQKSSGTSQNNIRVRGTNTPHSS